jgi:hypothetical protein
MGARPFARRRSGSASMTSCADEEECDRVSASSPSAESLPAAFTEAAAGQVLIDERPVSAGSDSFRTLVNLTNRRLEIADGATTIVIPPLGSRRIGGDRCARLDLGPLIDAGFLSEVQEGSGPHLGPALWALAGIMLVTVVALGGVARDATMVGITIALALTGLAAAFVLRDRTRSRIALDWMRQVPAVLKASLNFLLVIGIVCLLPGAILFFGSDVPRLFDLARQSKESSENDAATSVLIGVGLQWIFIVIASALPALLYFLFDREKLRTLRQRFIRQIFRLDPSLKTIADVNARYGGLLDEAYGRESGTEKMLPGRRSPIVVATALITLGWIITLLEPHLAEQVADTSLVSLFTPVPSAVAFAFLGAYLFSLNHLLRGFMRGDLRPKSYAHVAVRVLGATIFAFVLSKLTAAANPGVNGTDEGYLLVMAFIVGVLPETLILRLQELARGFVSKKGRLPSIYEPDPLTNLEGIDIYDRARLTDEGVTNVEGLAHHDFVDLLLKTRIPAPRLIDWVDQAVLYLHAGGAAADGEGVQQATLDRLRGFGIRTATDLVDTHRAAKRNGHEREFLAILPNSGQAPHKQLPRIRVILDALSDEPWMPYLRHWRSEPAKAGVIRYPADFKSAVSIA